jgi:uncharacterized protein
MTSPKYIRELPALYRLEASRCGGCGKVSYPPRPLCPACREEKAELFNLSPKGTVITSTVIHTPADEFINEAPFAMAIIETPEKARMMVQVVDCDPSKVMPGMDLELEFRLIRKEGHGGILCYGHKGVPVE